MAKFSSQEIESQYNLIKTLLSNPEKYKDAIDAIKKDISYMPQELKKKLEEENITFLTNNSLTTSTKKNRISFWRTSSFHFFKTFIKNFLNFFNKQKLRAIATNATAETSIEPS